MTDDQARPRSRRDFLTGAGLVGAGALLAGDLRPGFPLPPGLMPLGLVPLGLVPLGLVPLGLQDKPGLRTLSERPLNAETPVELLDPELTPNEHFFVRNNGIVPRRALARDLSGWALKIDGEVDRPTDLTVDALRRFPVVQRAVVIECGGNGRAGFHPPTPGNQWTLGAVGCAKFEGVRLADVLRSCGLRKSAVFVAFFGEDSHLSGNPDKSPISRGVPLAKALDEHTLLAFGMNGVPLPPQHGFPLRLVVPGWPGSCSGKWLRRLWVRDREHDGEKMTGSAYRLPKHPVAPGTKVAASDMAVIEQMPVKSVITGPATGGEHRAAQPLAVRGHAWSGAGDVAAVHLSIDFGQTWLPCSVKPAVNRYAWQRFTAEIRFPSGGYYEVWARATDHTGRQQPMVVPGWNPKGYCNNAMHRIAVRVV
ncbi:MAG: molybdopterin-dependent oxidoreductase [Planctomycetes bacterium]|nr:molybdopterin-dependent oxidoreductase [Planctomycetota bacterium]MCB9868785.1 molybdopterin-dependent oxidoreductase [Planctomycetota bacterium]